MMYVLAVSIIGDQFCQCNVRSTDSKVQIPVIVSRCKKVNLEWKKSWFSNIPYMTTSKESPKFSEFTAYDIGRYDFLFK